MSLARTDHPRANADPGEIARKLGLLDAPHVAPLTAFVRRLRAERGGDESIPWFDPTDAGTGARILMLFEAPGRRATAAQGSGFISADNNDGSAANMWRLLRDAGVDRSRETLAWNVVPWYIGSEQRIRAATPDDLSEARAALEELLSLLPDLRAVILFGKPAGEAWEQVGVEIPTIRAPHPSPRNLNGRPHYRPKILNALMQARWEAGLADMRPPATTVSPPPPRQKSTASGSTPTASAPRTPTGGTDPSREVIRALLIDGASAYQIAVRFDRRRGPYLVALEEEAKLGGEFNTFSATPENVVALRDGQRLRWERIAVRVAGDPRATALARELYDEAKGPGASRRSYAGKGRRFAEMED